MKFDYSILAYALVWRNLIVFMHNIVIYFVVAMIFISDALRPLVLLSIPGLLIVMINGIWISLLLGMMCLRFRDVQQLVTSVIQIAMLVTPIFWPESSLQGKARLIFVTFNPLFHFIDIVRAPLIGHTPQFQSYLIVVAVTIVGWIVTYVIFNRFRKRIAFWN